MLIYFYFVFFKPHVSGCEKKKIPHPLLIECESKDGRRRQYIWFLVLKSRFKTSHSPFSHLTGASASRCVHGSRPFCGQLRGAETQSTGEN